MVPFFRPSIEPEDEQRVLDCIRSGWLTTGKECFALEAAVRERVGVPYAVSFSSATAALHCALAYRRLQPGDEVIVPDYTFVATASSVLHAGGVPVLCDVGGESLNLFWDDVEQRITPRTRGVVGVDFAGLPFDHSRFSLECKERGLFLVDDAAHALGSELGGAGGVPVGGYEGIDACFSFYANKNVTTAEGGMLCTFDSDLDLFARRFRLHGMSVSAWNRYGGAWKPYDVEDVGWKCNMPDLCAALGIGQVRRLSETVARRTAVAMRYSEAFSGWEVGAPFGSGSLRTGHAWHLYIVRVPDGRRDALMAHLSARGVDSAIHYVPLHQLSAFRRPDEEFPVSTKAYVEVLSLPIYPSLSESEQGEVIDAVRSFFR